jgi:hypothetical protein
VTTKKKKPNENDDEISVCEVECQTHGDDTDCVATLIERNKILKIRIK